MSEPIADIAKQANRIADNPSDNFLSEKSIKYWEFQRLIVAFNRVLYALQAKQKLLVQSEEKLDESEERYRDLFQNNPGLVYTHDLEGYFVDTNLACKDQFGYEENDLVGINVKNVIHEQYRHLFKDYLKEVMENGESKGFMNFMTKSGGVRILEYENRLISV
ncbi:hypothetical protein DRO91_08960 [Candidatus Heimdallarchaeota archaeon]|nr:MAG: hypothetical protein DRO91_08960 [Candidatus Heimdallarchaeota archaeon]